MESPSRSSTPVQLGRLRADIFEPPNAFSAAFCACGSLYFRDFLTPDMLTVVTETCRNASFQPRETARLGTMEVESPRRAGFAISLALGQPALLRWLERATRSGPLARADGRIAQGRSGHPHELDWHDDQTDPKRRLAITINLTDNAYQGGLFEMRERGTGRVVTSHRHDERGAALIFEVSDRFEHRILPITAGGPRRVYTGWFYAPEALS